MRFLSRRRPIDHLAMDIDGPITKELDASFYYLRHALTAIVCVPVFVLLVTGTLSPTYYMLVPTGLVTMTQYTAMWNFSHWGMVLLGQLMAFVIFYDMSVYIRYPILSRLVVPMYRRFKLVKPAPAANFGVHELRSGVARRAQPKPFGRPLGDVQKERKKIMQEHHRAVGTALRGSFRGKARGS